MNNSCTPSMADFREAYVMSRTRDGLRTEAVIAAARADANRAITAHDAEVVAEATLQLRREAKAEALREVSDIIDRTHLTEEFGYEGYDGDGMMPGDLTIPEWLRARADRMEAGEQ